MTDQRILVSRESAKLLKPRLAEAFVDGMGRVVVDFQGVDGVAPSFVDELLHILGELRAEADADIVIENPPTRLSSKFAAVGRGHGLVFKEVSDGSWRLRSAPDPDNSSAPN